MEPLAHTAPPRETVVAIVPVLDEAEAIGAVVHDLLANGVGEVIVVDGNSTDGTADVARAAGARVIVEIRRGYGRAMMAGIAALPATAEFIVFFDGDGSDRATFVPSLIGPLASRRVDFAMGSRLSGDIEPGSLGLTQILAGYLAGWLIRFVYGVRFTDMSPFRALRCETLANLAMGEPTFGWNLEMQMRVAARKLRILELPVGQRCRRGGISKVSGNPLQAIKAAATISLTFVRLALTLRREQSGVKRHPVIRR